MILFTKRNLFFHDYQWTEYDKTDLKVSGKPGPIPFDRTEGNEVVYLINKLMLQWSYRFSNTGNKMEKLIRDKMPADLVTQEDVQNWLEQNLKF